MLHRMDRSGTRIKVRAFALKEVIILCFVFVFLAYDKENVNFEGIIAHCMYQLNLHMSFPMQFMLLGLQR